MSNASQRDLVAEYLELKERSEHIRSQIEERNVKGLDPLLAHVGNSPEMKLLAGLRKWWLHFMEEGLNDPPNEGMAFLGEFQVMAIEWEMAQHVASADVYYDQTHPRKWKVLATDGSRRGLGLGRGGSGEQGDQ